ncbi:MAG TPA: metalloregulator ArsR/SmtB family transcription factor [Jatrophihabitans sp.]|nr:metalloregulator ArsR/SmtB family transcription factor [Jatrophihabitans sp.]
MSEAQYEAASELLRVLSAPIRLAIITRLGRGPATVSTLTVELGHSQPLVSQHLRILRSARLVHAVYEGRERVYQLVDEHVAHIAADAIRHVVEPAAAPEAVAE